MKAIIFSTDSVEGLLSGRKTASRRVVKVPRGHAFEGADLSRAWPDNTSPFGPCLKVPCAEDTVQRIFCPYGSVGDRLYVKEVHWRWGVWQPTSNGSSWRFLPVGRHGPSVVFRLESGEHEAAREKIGWHKRSPLYLPQQHSRLVVELTAARFHRLQEMSEEDAMAEGVLPAPDPFHEGNNFWECYAPSCVKEGGCAGVLSAVDSFETKWDAINGKRQDCSWEANPWAVALSLRPCL